MKLRKFRTNVYIELNDQFFSKKKKIETKQKRKPNKNRSRGVPQRFNRLSTTVLGQRKRNLLQLWKQWTGKRNFRFLSHWLHVVPAIPLRGPASNQLHKCNLYLTNVTLVSDLMRLTVLCYNFLPLYFVVKVIRGGEYECLIRPQEYGGDLFAARQTDPYN